MNLNTLSILIYDSNMNLLTISDDNSYIDKYYNLKTKYNKYVENYANNYINFRHPFYVNFQTTFKFEIGYYETLYNN